MRGSGHRKRAWSAVWRLMATVTAIVLALLPVSTRVAGQRNPLVLTSGSAAYGPGYSLGAADGGVFDFGWNQFEGSLTNAQLTSPVTAVYTEGP